MDKLDPKNALCHLLRITEILAVTKVFKNDSCCQELSVHAAKRRKISILQSLKLKKNTIFKECTGILR